MLGGTFDRFHEGHRSLISTACNMADNIFVGIISEDWGKQIFAKKTLGEMIEPYDDRKQSVLDFLKNAACNHEVGPLYDPYGPAPNVPEADLMVVTTETEKTANKINDMRKEKGFNELDIIIIPWLKDEDGTLISSTRRREKDARK